MKAHLSFEKIKQPQKIFKIKGTSNSKRSTKSLRKRSYSKKAIKSNFKSYKSKSPNSIFYLVSNLTSFPTEPSIAEETQKIHSIHAKSSINLNSQRKSNFKEKLNSQLKEYNELGLTYIEPRKIKSFRNEVYSSKRIEVFFMGNFFLRKKS